MVQLAIPRDFHFKPVRYRVHTLGADAVCAARVSVAPLAVLAARVQRRQHHLDAGDLVLRVDIHRNAAPVVANGDRTVHVNGHVNTFAMTSQMFVHRVVEHLRDAVVQRPFIRAADIHAGLLADGLQTLQFAEFGRVVFVGNLRRLGILLLLVDWIIRHVFFRQQNGFFRHKTLSIEPF